MGGRHTHRADGRAQEEFEVHRGPRTVLLGALAVALIATIVGAVLVWPDRERSSELDEEVTFLAEGVTFVGAVVDEVQPACPSLNEPSDDCGQIRATVGSGDDAEEVTVPVPPEVSEAGLAPGDELRMLRIPGVDGQPVRYSFFGVERSSPLLLLTLLFVAVVVVVARWRGVRALLGLGFSGIAVLWFMLPALVSGESGLWVGLVGSALIVFVVLYTTHGFSIRTSAAVAGTLAGLAMTAVLGVVAVTVTHVTGVTDESGGILRALVGDLDFRGLLTCAVIVAGLGVLNDVTITQASAVWELRGAGPELTRRQLFAAGTQIGRDHIASTIYTIVFVYAGATLSTLMLLQLYGLPLTELLATEEMGQEVVRTLASATALVLAVPVTTGIAALTVPGPRRREDEGVSPPGR
jgi:uncharacterized membrane protein